MRRLYLRHLICSSDGVPPKGPIDRKKHEVDILERVLEGGVWTASGRIENVRAVELDFSTREWSLGEVQSTIRVQIFESENEDRKRRSARPPPGRDRPA
jgi:hypothetical protein